MPRLPFIPNLNLYTVTCIDCRVDPAQVLGVKLGEAPRTAQHRRADHPGHRRRHRLRRLPGRHQSPEGPYFEVAIIHHTDCGSALLAYDDLRHGFAQRIGTDERTLADTPVLARPAP